jgi:hypothetical protein
MLDVVERSARRRPDRVASQGQPRDPQDMLGPARGLLAAAGLGLMLWGGLALLVWSLVG